MKSLRFKPLCRYGVAFIAFIAVMLLPGSAQGARLSERSVSITDTKPSAVTTHKISFAFQTPASVGSLVFEYCSNDPLPTNPCTPPVGLSINASTLSSQSGETGFTIHASSTANRIILTRIPSVVVPGNAEYVFNNVTNPSTNNSANYVRLSTHASTDGSGARIDEGGVAFRILTGISTEAYVPPYLLFCVGINVDLDCTTATGNYLNLGELSASAAHAGTSQFAGATNDESGYLVSLFGTTMTSGNNAIAALTTPTISQPGSNQFGINLRANTDPSVGQDPIGSGTAAGTSDYNTPNFYKFVSGDTIGTTSLPSEHNRFTVSYIVNIAPNQAPGIYTSTFTYLASATF